MVCLTEGRTARLSVSLLQRSGFGNSSCRRLLRCSLSLCFCSVSTHGLCQRLPPDPTLRSVTIGSSDLAPTQSLPISSVHGWPIWMAAADGSEVTCVAGTMAEDEVSGWVNPVTFEQLWLPQDLPLPSCRAAVGAVMKNGMPRYLFPCLETTVSSGACHGANPQPFSVCTHKSFGHVTHSPADRIPITRCRPARMAQPRPQLSPYGQDVAHLR